jgi:hypothetical protein
MGNFVTAVYSGRLVSRSKLEQMLTAAKTHDGKATIYGLGFFLGGPIGQYKGVKEDGHGGINKDSAAWYTFCPRSNLVW